MVTPRRASANGESRSAKRRADDLSDADAISESKSESDYEEERPTAPRHQNSANSIGRRLVKRRRAGRAELITQSRAPTRAVLSSSPSTRSMPQKSSSSGEQVSGEEYEHSQSPTLSMAPALKWKCIPYPGFPVCDGPHLKILVVCKVNHLC
jgi:hypothetical protein